MESLHCESPKYMGLVEDLFAGILGQIKALTIRGETSTSKSLMLSFLACKSTSIIWYHFPPAKRGLMITRKAVITYTLVATIQTPTRGVVRSAGAHRDIALSPLTSINSRVETR